MTPEEVAAYKFWQCWHGCHLVTEAAGVAHKHAVSRQASAWADYLKALEATKKANDGSHP